MLKISFVASGPGLRSP